VGDESHVKAKGRWQMADGKADGRAFQGRRQKAEGESEERTGARHQVCLETEWPA